MHAHGRKHHWKAAKHAQGGVNGLVLVSEQPSNAVRMCASAAALGHTVHAALPHSTMAPEDCRADGSSSGG
jgi:hypothetical protein